MRESRSIAPSRFASAALLAALMTAFAARPAAHDVPGDVVVRAFFKPEGDVARLLVRAPLGAMLDVDYPQRGPGYLELDRVEPSLRQAVAAWLVRDIAIYEGDERLGEPRVPLVRISLPSDRSFATYEEALAHLAGPPLAPDTDLYWNQAMLDVLLEYPIRSDRSAFSIDPRLARLGQRVTLALEFRPPDGPPRAFQFHGDPGLVWLDPRWHQAALRFVGSGFAHILDGIDHLLFLLCLVIPFRQWRPLVLIVTSFTVAHSVTLIASAYGVAPDALWFPPLVETLIALSIVYMALENIVSPHLARRWIVTFLFGLVHGFGFSFGLRETLQFAGSHLVTALLSFNVGVELGQLVVLLVLVPALGLAFKYVVAERLGTIILSAIVAHTGWHWMVERADLLAQFQFEWPALTPALLAAVLRWLMVIVIAGGAIWLGRGLQGRRRAGPSAKQA